MLKKNAFIVSIIVLWASSTFAGEIRGFCNQVVDANTLIVNANGNKNTVKLAYIDSPVPGQKFGAEAKRFVEGLALNQQLRIYAISNGGNHITAEVFSPKKQDSINRELIRKGLAWPIQANSGKNPYELTLRLAKKRQLGVWSDPSIKTPAEYRKRKEEEQRIVREKKEKEKEARILDAIIRRAAYEDKMAKQRGVNTDTVFMSQKPAPANIETRPGYRPEDIAYREQLERLNYENSGGKYAGGGLMEGNASFSDSFSSAHSGSGRYSRKQKEMEFNEWAIKHGAEAPYKDPDVIIKNGHGHGHINDDHYGGVIDSRTGKFYPKTGNGIVDPQTGKHYPRSGNGYIDPANGRYIPVN